jgi:1-acyl-sn-glycerol-3-phosphate acyltransferase
VMRLLESNPVPVVPLALQNLWGSFFSRAGGRAMTRPFRRGILSRVTLVAGDPLPASAVTPAALRERVGRLLAS